MPKRKATQKSIRQALNAEDFYIDRNDPRYFTRHVDVAGGAVSVTERKWNGKPATRSYRVTWYNGNPVNRWSSKSFESFKDAVACVNEQWMPAVQASAGELGPEYLEKYG